MSNPALFTSDTNRANEAAAKVAKDDAASVIGAFANLRENDLASRLAETIDASAAERLALQMQLFESMARTAEANDSAKLGRELAAVITSQADTPSLTDEAKASTQTATPSWTQAARTTVFNTPAQSTPEAPTAAATNGM